jgi:hypothetical protein
MQQSLQERNTGKGNQQGFYFLTFYQSDATCSKFSQLYDPVADPFNMGIFSNPVRIDKTQAQCQQIAYGISWGVLSASSRYINLRQFSSSNCSGAYEDFVRMPGAATLAGSCWMLPTRLSTATPLYYRVTYVNHNNFALNYALPSYGYESFDYHPAKGLFFLGNIFNNEVSSFNPTGSAQDARPNLAGGRGYPPMDTNTLNIDGFSFGSDSAVAKILRDFGLNSAGAQPFSSTTLAAPAPAPHTAPYPRHPYHPPPGLKVDYALTRSNPQLKSRNRVWVTRCQFWGDLTSSPYGGATAIDFSTPNGPTQVRQGVDC